MDEGWKYAAKQAGRRSSLRRRRHIPIVVALIAVIALLGMLPVEVCHDCAFICENTGSWKGHRQWCVGLRSGQWYRESRLEQFVRERYPCELRNRWASCRGTGKTIFGWPASFHCGQPRLDAAFLLPAVFDRYVDALDDAAKLELYRLLVAGDRQAIRAAGRKIEEMASARGWDMK